MPAPSTMSDLSTTASSNYPAGTDVPSTLDDAIRALAAVVKTDASKGVDIASASSITIPEAGSYFVVTGTTTITAIANASWTGREVTLKFSGVLTLTHGSGLILPGSANITTAAGDVFRFVYESSGVWRCVNIEPVSGYQPLDADTAKTDQDQSWTGSPRATPVTDNDGSFDMNAGLDFLCTPTAGFTLTFTNITQGQRGSIYLVNGSNYAIAAAATTKVTSMLLSSISTTGEYWLSYWSPDGTNVLVTHAGDFA